MDEGHEPRASATVDRQPRDREAATNKRPDAALGKHRRRTPLSKQLTSSRRSFACYSQDRSDISPDLLGHIDNEPQLIGLRLHGDLVAMHGRGESALR